MPHFRNNSKIPHFRNNSKIPHISDYILLVKTLVSAILTITG
jgi:hypothetical protein